MILGAVIAGGRASRFGSDKALARWRGRPLIALAREALAPWCAEVVVCGTDRPGYPALPDRPAPGLGPLGGIAAALAYAEERGFASVLTIGCDMPEVPGAVIAELVERAPAYCPDAPVLGHWPAAALQALIDRLTSCVPAKAGTQSGPPPSRGYKIGPSIRRWAADIAASTVPAPGLRNVNTPADLTS